MGDQWWSPVILEHFCTSRSLQRFNFNVHFSKLLVWDISGHSVQGYSASFSMTPAAFSWRISNAAQARSICPGLRGGGGGGTLFMKIFWTVEVGVGGWGELWLVKIAQDGCTVGCIVYSSRGLVQVSWGAGLRAEAGWETAVRTSQPVRISTGLETSGSSFRWCGSILLRLKGVSDTQGWSNSNPDSWPRFLPSHQLYFAFVYFHIQTAALWIFHPAGMRSSLNRV